jgi:hypothetical protein
VGASIQTPATKFNPAPSQSVVCKGHHR